MKELTRLIVFSASFAFLAACGGGGGGSDTESATCSGSGTTTLSGTIRFERVMHDTNTGGLDYSNIQQMPVRGARLEAICSVNDSILATTNTDDSGTYQLSVTTGVSIIIRVKAQMLRTGTPSWNFSVVDNTDGNALYAMQSDTFTTSGANQTLNLIAESGWGGSSYTGPRVSGPFAILDSVFVAFQKILEVAPNASFPSLTLHWSVNNRPSNDFDIPNGDIVTSFYSNRDIFILGEENSDTDEFDGHVLIHEWGHYFEDVFSRSDSIGGPHADGAILDMRVAFSEGWSNAWSGIAKDDPVYLDSFGNRQSLGFSFNVEDNVSVSPGWYSEGSVQSILYDLFDDSDDGPDTISLGFQPIYDVFVTQLKNADALTSIFPFITALKTNNPAQITGIDAIVAAQSIESATMDAFGTTETNDAGVTNPIDVLPIYKDLTPDGTTEVVCSINEFGEPNKLGNVQH
ncbi:MAG: hypothetical protein MJA83_12135, partial [Gammaproteobacteria bacterium]|nr:hypothetical protein [Gammaproteobacteria bacterium]